MKVFKVIAQDFVRWLYSSSEEITDLGISVLEKLERNERVQINAQELLDECNQWCIPMSIVMGIETSDEFYDYEFGELIEEGKIDPEKCRFEIYDPAKLDDDIRDIAIRMTDKLVELKIIPNCIDTDDETEFEVQDALEEIVKEFLTR